MILLPSGQEVGLVERRLADDHPPRTEYLLTHKGQRLTPTVLAVAAGVPAAPARITFRSPP